MWTLRAELLAYIQNQVQTLRKHFRKPRKKYTNYKCIPLLKNNTEELWVVVDKVKNNLKAEQSFSLFLEFDCPDIGTLVIRTMGYEPSKNLLSFNKKILVKKLIVLALAG